MRESTIIIIIVKKSSQCKAGRERLTPYQSDDPDPNPTTPSHRMKEEKGKTAGDKKWASSYASKKALALLLKPISPTPSNTASLRSFHIHRYWQGNKSPAILRGSAARRRIRVPMSNHSTACAHRHIRHRKSTIKRVHQITPDLVHHT